jgi:hypothetical protein
MIFVDLFKFRDTHGLPLSVQMGHLIRAGILFSVPHFVVQARAAGWKPEKIQAELREAWLEVGVPKRELEEMLCLAKEFT